MEVNEAGDDDLEESTMNQWGMFWLILMRLLAVCSVCVAFAWIKFPENKVVQRSQEYVMAGLLTIMGVMIITIFLKFIWHSCRREMSHSRRAVRYQCPLRDDESKDYGESEGQCGPYQEPQDLGKVPERSDTFCTRPDLDRRSYSRSGGQTVGQFSEPEQVQSEADGTGVKVRNSEGTCDPTALASHDVTPIPSVPTNEHQLMTMPRIEEYPVRRTFSGSNADVWAEFLQYFENLAELNAWGQEKSSRVLLSTLRGQAETFDYGLPFVFQGDYNRFKRKMEERFWNTAMKERYMAEAKLRKGQAGESLRDFGQALEDLYRRAYPENPDIVEENAIKAFLDKCGQSEDFRLAIKRTRPKTLQEAVVNAMQEECLRVSEKDLAREKPANRAIYEVEDGMEKMCMITDASGSPKGRFY
jgi:hypothetical protein